MLCSRLQETKGEKRVEVVKYYVAYLQADQALKIATYQMQTVAQESDSPTRNPQQVASHRLQPDPSQITNSLNNKEYVAAATEMLTASAQARVALEELAACVGLSAQETLVVFNERESP